MCSIFGVDDDLNTADIILSMDERGFSHFISALIDSAFKRKEEFKKLFYI